MPHVIHSFASYHNIVEYMQYTFIYVDSSTNFKTLFILTPKIP